MGSTAIIFDLDGTLFDSCQLSLRAFEQTLEKLEEKGIFPREELPPAIYKHVIGMTTEEVFVHLMPNASPELRGYAIELLDDIEQVLLETEGFLFPGVREGLNDLKKLGHKLYIASNGGARYVPSVVRRHDLHGLFEGVFCAGLHKTKNKNDLVKMIVSQGITRAIMVGDRTSDVEAGRSNQLVTIGCAYGFGTPEETGEADYVIQSFKELPPLVNEIATTLWLTK